MKNTNRKLVDAELLNYIIHYARIGMNEVLGGNEIKDTDTPQVANIKANITTEMLARLRDIDALSEKINGIK